MLYLSNGGFMFIIFNPTDKDLEYEINWKKWSLQAGETAKFPNDIGSEMVKIHGFLQVLDKDEDAPKPIFTPPKNLKDVPEADAEDIKRDRRIKHPSSNPKVVATQGFSGTDMTDREAGLPAAVKKEMVDGKLMDVDKDGVGWYGKGIEIDNPLAKEKVDNDSIEE